MESKEELPTHQLTEVGVEEIKIPKDVEMAVPASEIQEGTYKEPESEVDTISASETKATEATTDETAEITATETSEATATEAEESTEEKGESTAGSTVNTNSPVAIIQEQPTPQDAAVSKEPVAEMTAPEEEAQHKLEEQAKEVVLSDKVEDDAERPEEFHNLEAAATDDAPAKVAPDATVGVEDTNEAPKEENTGKKIEPLASEVAPIEAIPDATIGVEDKNEASEEENTGEKVEPLPSEVAPTEATPDAAVGLEDTNAAPKEENTGTKVESLASEVVLIEAIPDATVGVEDTNQAPKEESAGKTVGGLASSVVIETEAIYLSSATTTEETNASSVNKGVTEPNAIEQTQIKDNQEEVSDVKKDQVKVGKPSEGEDEVPRDLGTCTVDVAQAPSNSEDKALEVEVHEEDNENESSSDIAASDIEVATVPGVVEEIKRRTLEGLLLAEKNTSKLATEQQSTVPPQEEIPSDSAEDPNGNAESGENVVANAGDLETSETAKYTEMKDPATTEEEREEPAIVKGNEAAVEDMKETKERDVSEESMDAEEEIIGNSGSNPVKPSQHHSNNIMSKVKQSIVKVKKAIIGKSSSSKIITSSADKDDIMVK